MSGYRAAPSRATNVGPAVCIIIHTKPSYASGLAPLYMWYLCLSDCLFTDTRKYIHRRVQFSSSTANIRSSKDYFVTAIAAIMFGIHDRATRKRLPKHIRRKERWQTVCKRRWNTRLPPLWPKGSEVYSPLQSTPGSSQEGIISLR